MFKSSIKAGLVAASIGISAMSSAIAGEFSVTNFTFEASHRDMPVQTLVWYPSKGRGVPVSIGDDPVFVGVHAERDAKPSQGKHPVVILSHGAGGNAANLAWIASRMAEAGFIVFSPNHPGSTSRDSRPETNILAWQRPQDVSALLDAIAASKGWSNTVDQDNVTVIGFSMGGYTALAMAGARVHAADLAAYCDRLKDAPDCVWYDRGNDFIKGHVDLHAIDAANFDAAYGDKRVKRIVAIDPAIAQAFDVESLKSVAAPTLLINLGQGDAVPEGVRVDKIAAHVPGVQRVEIEEADHFTFMAECKTLGWVYIWFEGDDPVCSNPGTRSRAEMHEEITGKLLAFLKPATTQ
jgi:predicted dienelactone hydrolase